MLPNNLWLRALYLTAYSSAVIACGAQLLSAALVRDCVILPASLFNLYLLLGVVPRNWA